jgi:hypothetical protein
VRFDRRWFACLVLLLVSAVLPTRAAILVTIDRATLDELLSALSQQDMSFPLTESHSVDVKLDDLQILDIDPEGGADGQGQILTSVRIRVPDFGINLRVEPRISLRVVQHERMSFLELRFDEVPLQLPMTGAVDLSTVLPVTRFPAHAAWTVDGAGGEVEVRSRLVGIEMDEELIRLTLEVVVPETP